MLALGIVAIALGQSTEVAEYFPLNFGRKWVYSSSEGSASGQYEVVGIEQELKGGKASPIISKVGDDVVGSIFYRVVDDEVQVVAFEQNKPLAAPYPVLKIGTGKTEWSYSGETQWVGEMSPLSLKGVSKRNGSRDILGKKYDTVEVTLDAVIGDEKGMFAKSHQVAVYAKGIGLVEMTDVSTFNKTKKEHHRKLVSFSPGTSG